MRPAILAALAGVVSGASTAASSPAEDVSVTVTGLRSGRGQIMACLTAQASSFPDCKHDATARHLIVPAGTGAAPGPVVLDFGPVPPGTYAISLFHDENGNGKLDTVMIMPKEGYGFSRDAKVRFGPPSFAAAAFGVSAGPVHQSIRMRYMF